MSNFYTGFTPKESNSSRRCCFTNEVSMFSTSSCQGGQKNQTHVDERCDVAVPGPSCSCSSLSPSQGPCSPEAATKRSIDQSELCLDSFQLQKSDSIVGDKYTSNPKEALCTANEKSTQSALLCSVETRKLPEETKKPKSKDLELELRAACAHALSLCAFQDELEMEINR